MKKETIIKGVREYAEDHYNDKFGWSEVVEAWSDFDIWEVCYYAASIKTAIKLVEEVVDLRDAVRNDIIGWDGDAGIRRGPDSLK